MPTVLLPLLPGTLLPGQCYDTEQERLVDFAAHLEAQLDGETFFNYGDTKPDPEFNAYPWLRTTDMRLYRYSGGWITPVNYDLNERRWFAGSLVDLQTYDGGDTGAASDRSGPMWVEDTDFQGRSPMHPGAIPSANPAKTLVVGEDHGEGAHTQLEAELARHRHDVTLDGGGNDGSAKVWTAVTDNAVELTYQTTETGDSEPMPVIHPVRGLFCIKWSGRLYRLIP